ncbi:MAG TPA: tripartite tricarboxylate transporter substrate-binding protein [Xanthobacteraceae bacterium]|jgi:tripartite-type tricarboxylate transporter receptor subunit TctC|nr:tripartite tricarboxylate transporter substrate-binding protein [Xanthobacteraceae bacterium]
MTFLIRGALALLPLLLATGGADAQSWPAKPIRFIVTQAAGGTPDIICRLLGDRLSRVLGQQVVVENRPGAGNTIGMQMAARAAPDGYTFVFATAAALVTNPYTFKSLPYDPVADFVPVAMVAKGPFIVLSHPSVPAKTLGELFAYDKANPGKLAYATDGPRNFSGIVAAWLNKLGGVDILQVPYATMPQGVQDTLAGRVPLTILAVPSAAPHIGSGALRPLAVTSLKRLSNYPDVPAISESFPGIEVIGWFVIAAPAGTPVEVVTRVNRELDKILKDPEIVSQLATVGFFTEGADTPEATRAFVRSQYDLWGKVAHDIGLRPE